MFFDLKEVNHSDIQLVGGKAANLGEMVQAGFNVPPGFIVTTEVYNRFLEENEIQRRISSILENCDLNEIEIIRKASHEIYHLFEKASFVDHDYQMIIDKLRAFPEKTRFAIRSSATAEDLENASFAGQQDTFLDIQDHEDIMSCIKRCFASLYSDRAITYRIQQGFAHDQVKIAVVVQKMIPAEISGILFTVDPISQDRRKMVINASYGLGEAIVSGIVTPDLYLIDKKSNSILKKQVSRKEAGIFSNNSSGTMKQDIPSDLQDQEVLSQPQVEDLARLGKQVEKHYISPQDIEWSISDGRIYLLQSRPITSLFPQIKSNNDEKEMNIYFSFGHAQMMTEPISPMGISILSLLLPFGRPPRKVIPSPYLHSTGGYLYIDITPILNTIPGRNFFPRFLINAEPTAARMVMELVQRPEFRERNRHSKKMVKLKMIPEWVVPLFFRLASWILFRDYDQVSQRTLKRNACFLNHVQQTLGEIQDPIERLEFLQAKAASFLYDHLAWMLPLVSSGILAKQILEKWLAKGQDIEQLNKVWRGLAGNITTEMDLMVGDLADIIRNDVATRNTLEKYISSKNFHEMKAKLPPDFLEKWELFIKIFGMRGPGEIDISRKRWAENPDSVIQAILGNLQNQEGQSSREHFRSLQIEAMKAQETILSKLKSSPFGWIKVLLAKRLFTIGRNALAIREHPKYLIVRFMNIIRNELTSNAILLVEKSQIDNEQDIWYLKWQEIKNALQNRNIDIKSEINRRKLEYQAIRHLTPPIVVTGDGEIPRRVNRRNNLPEGVLIGDPVSPGVVEGIARIILDPTKEQLLPGEILIAPFTDPGWTPLFINAAGVVLETGGLMTHGSVVAREYGLPAVVGVFDATVVIRTGQHIRVNADEGYIEFL